MQWLADRTAPRIIGTQRLELEPEPGPWVTRRACIGECSARMNDTGRYVVDARKALWAFSAHLFKTSY
jgi:hypothetical protein